MSAMDFFSAQASDDFNKARGREMISRVINLLKPQTNKLLSLSEIKSLIRPRGERYRGMQPVPISQIVGSEGRYRDFNKAFLPRYEHMRQRWESVDKAHLQDIILPPIKLYQVGDVFFVRDGNNRVSVARAQGVGAIDAEVVELTSEFAVKPGMGKEEIITELLKYERERFINQTHLDTALPLDDLTFSSPGRYDEVINHIMVHKYFINQERKEVISFQDAAISWYNQIFHPIMEAISQDGIIARFPGRTKADLYMWISQHWDSLKGKYGEKVSMSDAVKDFSNRFGKSLWDQFLGLFKR